MDERWSESLIPEHQGNATSDRTTRTTKSNGSDGGADISRDDEFHRRAMFEIPVVFGEDGSLSSMKLGDPEVSARYSMQPSKVNGKWSGIIEGRSSSMGRSIGSLTLDYKSSKTSTLSLGMIHGQQSMHPLLSMGGKIQLQRSTTMGLTLTRSQPMDTLRMNASSRRNRNRSSHLGFAIQLNHRPNDSSWAFQSQLTRTKILVLSAKRSNAIEAIARWNLRRPKYVTFRLDLKPRISQCKSLHTFAQWRIGLWSMGGSIVQSLHSSAATVGMGIRIKSNRGLEWVLSWNRGDACVRIPVFISRTLHATSIGHAVYMSFFSYLFQDIIAELWEWNQRQSTEAAQRAIRKAEEVKNAIKSRKDAELQRELMVRQAERKMKQEIKSNGLIVQKATYAVPAGGNGGNPKSLDVTVQLQFWVNKSTLTLSASSKKDLLGFYDITAAEDDSVDEEARKVDAAAPPHRGDATADSLWWQLAWQSLWEDNDDTADPDDSMEQTKKPSSMPELLIDYTYKGKPMHVRVQDNEALQLP